MIKWAVAIFLMLFGLLLDIGGISLIAYGSSMKPPDCPPPSCPVPPPIRPKAGFSPQSLDQDAVAKILWDHQLQELRDMQRNMDEMQRAHPEDR